MIYAALEDGWVRIPYTGSELGRVEIGFGEDTPVIWSDAYLNTVKGVRVAQVRPPLTMTETPNVWIRVDGLMTLIGRLGQGVFVPSGRRRRG